MDTPLSKRIRFAGKWWLDRWTASSAVSGTLIEKVEGHEKPGSRPNLVILVHYDPQGHWDPYLAHLARSLSAELHADLVVVSTSSNSLSPGFQEIRNLASTIMYRRNLGYDFASYHLGLLQAGMKRTGEMHHVQYDNITLVNDSVYGPLFPIRLPDSDTGQVFGITDNREFGRYHLQSYFLSFNRAAYMHPAFAGFWKRHRLYRYKDTTVRYCEAELSRQLSSQGVKLKAMFSFDDLVGIAEAPAVNPVLHLQSELLSRKCPFVKTSQFKAGLSVQERERMLNDIYSTGTDYPVDLIRNHIKRLQL